MMAIIFSLSVNLQKLRYNIVVFRVSEAEVILHEQKCFIRFKNLQVYANNVKNTFAWSMNTGLITLISLILL